MPDEEQQLTPAQRKRNVERVKDIERQLGLVELDFSEMVYTGAKAIRRLHGMREELRDVFGMEPLAELAPLYDGIAARADVLDEAAPPESGSAYKSDDGEGTS